MTLFHFGNCVALAYVPYVLTYKLSGLSEYGVFWKCVQAGGVYLVTQLCKLLVLATFFPTFDDTNFAGLTTDLFTEFFKSTVDLADFVGLYLVISRMGGKTEIKLLVAGLGWATAEVITTRLLPLWFGARGLEFDWKYIQMSFDCNISMVQHITTAALIWLWSKQDQTKPLFPIIVILLVATCYKPLFTEILQRANVATSWSLLGLKALVTVVIGFATLNMYLGLGINQY